METFYYARVGRYWHPTAFYTLAAARQCAAAMLASEPARRKAFVDRRRGKVLAQVAEVQRSDASFARWVADYRAAKEPAREAALRRKAVRASGSRRP